MSLNHHSCKELSYPEENILLVTEMFWYFALVNFGSANHHFLVVVGVEQCPSIKVKTDWRAKNQEIKSMDIIGKRVDQKVNVCGRLLKKLSRSQGNSNVSQERLRPRPRINKEGKIISRTPMIKSVQVIRRKAGSWCMFNKLPAKDYFKTFRNIDRNVCYL